MDNNKKVILELYDMIRELRESVTNLEDNYDYYSDTFETRCRELKELGFSKYEVREILGINNGLVTQMVNSIFEEE